MSRMVRRTLLAALVALPIIVPRQAAAYDATNTHKWLARESVELLVATYPGEYDELLEHIEDVVDGAYHEDDIFLDGDTDPKTLRVMRHFFYAPNGKGLTYDGREYPNSYQWHGVGSEQNEWDYNDGLVAYQKGDYTQAYFIVGHTIHLIADATVPAHTHLDDHGPPTGDDYENHCTDRMINEYEGSLRKPPIGVSIPQFDSLEAAFQLTADASYYRNFYPGYLEEDGEAGGVIKKMFPEIGQGWITGKWQIPDIGNLDDAFFEEQPNFFYLSKNNAASEYDVVNYDPLNPSLRSFGPVEGGAPVVERMADDLVPVAIVHSAAVIKMFVDEARALPPIVVDDTEDDKDPPNDSGCSSSNGSSAPWFALLLLFAYFRRTKSSQRNARN